MFPISIPNIITSSMHRQHPTTAAEPIVQTSEIHGTDPRLSQRGSTHDARFHGDVQIGFAQDAQGVAGGDFGEGDEFGVSGALF